MKHICNFSGGLCSFFAAQRVVKQYGPLNTVLLFADTLIEDPDLYDFLNKGSAMLGVPLNRVSYGLTPWQLFRQEKMIGNNRFPICSVYLKREQLDKWMIENFEMNVCGPALLLEHATLHVGFDWTEEHRLRHMRSAHPTWRIEAPMQQEPIWDKCRMFDEAARLGFKKSNLYQLGFPHDNCGGRCVRAGISHWVHLLRTLPKRYMEWENEELSTAEYLTSEGVEPLSILKDRREGTVRNLYLRDLRLRVEAGEKFDQHDWGGCGCGGVEMAAA